MNKKYYTFDKEPFFQIAYDYISDSSRVLDIGPGDGSFSNFCGRNDFYLFEGNLESVRKLEKTYKNVFLGELPNLPFEDNYFDLIHCSHVIEHLQPQEFYETLKEIDRCLKIKGVLVVSAPLIWEGFYNDISHVKPYNPKVFYNYLIHNNSLSRTRAKISIAYEQKQLIYRYREVSITQDLYQAKDTIILRLFFKAARILKKLGLKKHEKTGYTIVLKKNG